MNFKDMANQLLLPILDDMDPCDIQLSIEKEVMEVKLRKGLNRGNAKLSNWIGTFLKASTVDRRATFVTFWLCKFVFGSHSDYAVKLVYF